MTAPVFGITTSRPDDEPLPVLGADFSKCAFVSTSADADPNVFPLLTAVRFSTNDKAFTGKLGTGYLADAVRAVNDQLGPLSVAADCIIVRVAEGATGSASAKLMQTFSNIIAGLEVLRDAPSEVNATPRIVGFPGYTAQQPSGVASVAITARGSGFTSAPGVAASGGGGIGAAFSATISKGVTSAGVGAGGTGYTAAAVAFDPPVSGLGQAATGTVTVATGAVTGITITDKGHGYADDEVPAVTISGDGTGATATVTMTGVLESIAITDGGYDFTSAPTLAITGGAGSGATATATVELLANPVIVAAPAVLGGLLAVAIVDAPSSSRQAAEAWRETVNSDRIIPVGVAARVLENGAIVTRPMSSRIIGLMIRSDNAHEGKPFHPIANQPIYGIVGISRPISFSLTDGATEGQLLLAADIGVVVQGEQGVDTAIADGGYIYIGTESCAEGDLWAQFHQVRGADYLTVKMLRLTRQFLGKKIDADVVEAWLNSIKFMLRDHKALKDILGYALEFPTAGNSPETIRLGRLRVVPKIEPGPVFRVAEIEQRRYRPAIDELITTIVSRLGAAA
ncbi:hypothetical protein [Bosea sp. (in: a-proteobacteria)]